MRLRYIIFASAWGALWMGSSGFGACAGESAGPRYDLGGNAQDMGNPFGDGSAGDLGSATDMGLARSVQLATPAPWSSNNRADSIFEFIVLLPSVPAQPETWLSVTPRGSTTMLAGGFSSKLNPTGGYKVTFYPSAQLQTGDYVVTALDPQNSSVTLLRTGISVGSKPRVKHLYLKNMGAQDLLLEIVFSEAMKQSTIGAHLEVRSGSPPGAPIAGTLTRVDDASYTFLLPNGASLSGPFLVRLTAGVTSLGDVPLDPASWDAPTDQSGAFEHELFGAFAKFEPEVN
jgi:hypothetical protein